MQKYLFLSPVYKEMIWGGKKLHTIFGFEIPSDNTGEAWVISAHKNGDCLIKNGEFQGKTLSYVYENHKELFGNSKDIVFPLLAKIIDANNDLSIQVHPEDEYARKHANDLGKTECWYILDALPNSYIIYGHNAKTKEELINLINKNEWEKLLKKVNAKKGDFIYVPAGTVHAICKGLLILEIQQSSDTTYRFYDYNREDTNGNKRQLHLKEAVDVMKTPHIDYEVSPKIEMIGNTKITELITSPYFHVSKINIVDEFMLTNPTYLLINVIDGHGIVDGLEIKKGDAFVVTSAAKSIKIIGNLEILSSRI